MKRLLALGAFIALGGCAAMSKNECASADWWSVGYQDGARGAMMAAANTRGKACHKHGFAMDHVRYREGRTAGLAEFCTPARAYDLGARGGAYNGVCRRHGEAAFLTAYEDGLAYHSVASALDHARNALIRANDELAYIDAELVALAAEVPARVFGDGPDMTADEIAQHAAAVATHLTRRSELESEIIPALRADLVTAQRDYDRFLSEARGMRLSQRMPAR